MLLNKHSLIFQHQIGFQKNKSTEDDILDLYRKILLNSIDNKDEACATVF